MFVRMIAVEVIEDAGYDVVEAENAELAMNLLDERDDIGVLFTDIMMPGKMDGLALAAAVRDRWPTMPIILTSGHAYESGDALSGAACFLQKPYRARLLIDQLARIAAC